jgi:hypothetical protein
MKNRKILVPVYEALSAASIARSAFWLAHAQDADLYLVAVIPPPGLLSWLLSHLLKRRGNAQLAEARRQAVWVEQLRCKTAELHAPNLLIGIVESARQVRPDMVILVPELQERLGRVGVAELKQHLGEISCCTLVLPARGLALRIVPCGKRSVITLDRAKGLIQEPGSVIFPECWNKSAGENSQDHIRRIHDETV